MGRIVWIIAKMWILEDPVKKYTFLSWNINGPEVDVANMTDVWMGSRNPGRMWR